MGETFKVSQPVLDWIFSVFPVQELSSDVQELLIKWKKDSANPTYSQLEKVSKKLNIPLGYLFMEKPPKDELPLAEFRTINSADIGKPSRELIDTYHSMLHIQEWMEDWKIDEGYEELDLDQYLQNAQTPVCIADRIREAIGLEKDYYKQKGKKSFNYLKTLISNFGILVMQNGMAELNTRRSLSLEEFRGFALSSDYAPLIFINSKDSDSGKAFTLLHELAHLFLGQSDLLSTSPERPISVSPAEQKANAIAAELLLPESEFLKLWESEKGLPLERCQKIAGKVGCSLIVTARRALDFQFISKVEYIKLSSFNQVPAKKKNKNNGGPNFYTVQTSRLDPNFLSCLQTSLKNGTTSYTEAYRLTHTNRKTFDRLVQETQGMVRSGRGL